MKPDLFDPAALDRDTPPPLSDYGWRLLAEGDSWFSLTTVGQLGSNLLAAMALPRSAAVVNCAAPGATLQRMVDRRADARCARLLAGRRARYWGAVLLSGGGNDLIAAAQTPITLPDGSATPPAQRILRTPAEAGAATSAADWINDAGWALLAGHLRSELALFAGWRDAGPSAARAARRSPSCSPRWTPSAPQAVASATSSLMISGAPNLLHREARPRASCSRRA